MINWIDFTIIIIFATYMWDGYRRGFLRLTWELLGIIVAFVFALKFYIPVANLFEIKIPFSSLYAKPMVFLVIWFLAQFIFYIAGHYLSFYTPVFLRESKLNHYLGLIPAALKGIIFISIILISLMILPISSGIKMTIQRSSIGNILVKETSRIENKFEKIFDRSGSGNSIFY